MTILINEKFSNFQLALIAGGTLMTASGALDLGLADLGNGLAKTIAGMTVANLGTIGHSTNERNEVIKISSICGTAPAILYGIKNFCSGINQKNLDRVRDGVLQMTFGIGCLNFLTSLSSRSVSVISQTVSASALSGGVAYIGMRRIAEGKTLTGITQAAFGLGGIALSGLIALNELSIQ